ncbi:MAG: ABC transporter permease [Acidobacteria bacterium]|nr:ABC transporter permease [Acidobacteriota bacterium]
MQIPLSYNLRNLTARKTTTAMTALGIALTVAVLLSVSALVQGLRTSLAASGNPLQVLVLRKGGTAELNSVITRTAYQDILARGGIARDEAGQPKASLEVVTVIVLESAENPGGININLRGLTPMGFQLRDEVTLSAGRMFRPGYREIVVGKSLVNRYGVHLGQKLRFGRGDWEVVGIMDGGRTSANSEVFADLNQLAADQNRTTALSSVLLRAEDEASVNTLINDLETDRRLNVDAMPERDYYAQQTSSAAPIQALGTFVALIMSVGSSFAAMNTMYAAVARRSAEIGTLRVLGFSRRSILVAFLIESVLLSLIGGLLGCLLVLPLNGIETGVGSFVTFSELTFSFHITPQVMLTGVLFAVFMGVLGGILPAASAARKQILTALRSA